MSVDVKTEVQRARWSQSRYEAEKIGGHIDFFISLGKGKDVGVCPRYPTWFSGMLHGYKTPIKTRNYVSSKFSGVSIIGQAQHDVMIKNIILIL